MPYLNRLQKLQHYLGSQGCDAMIIDSPLNMFYLTGLNLSAGKLLIHSKGAHFIVDDRYFELCQKAGPYPVLQSATPTFELHLSNPDFSTIKNLAFDTETTSYKNYLELEKYIKNIVKASKSKRKLNLVPLDNPVKVLRTIKDVSEIHTLREAALLGSKGFDYVCTLLKEDVKEIDIASELEIFWKRLGARSVAFDPIIAFGPNSSMPHYRPGNERLKRGQAVLIDIGVNYRHYHSDMTRVVFFGEPDPKIKAIYPIVKKAQELALEKCRPGVSLGELDAAARDYIASHGYGERFTHSLGHGVGLEIHELPTIRNSPPYRDKVLEPGMVITIEPGIYLPGMGGIRLEDMIVITSDGHENLTRREISSNPII